MLTTAVHCQPAAAQDLLIRRIARRTQLVGAFAAGALVCASLFAFAAHSPPTTAAPPRELDLAAKAAGQPRLDRLRQEAVMGDELSNRELSIALLDRYDSMGDPNDLYEATVWIERRWDLTGSPELIARVVAHYCEQRVVRWHAFCISGE